MSRRMTGEPVGLMAALAAAREAATTSTLPAPHWVRVVGVPGSWRATCATCRWAGATVTDEVTAVRTAMRHGDLIETGTNKE